MRKLLGVVGVALCLTFSAFAADVDSLINQLKDKDNDARRAAAKALAEAGGDAKAAAPALVTALKDKDMFVRRFAAMALGEIGAEPRDALPGLKKALLDDARKEVQEAAATAMGKMGGEAVAPLAAVVKDGNRETDVRRKAVEALGALGSEARPAVPTLLEALKGGGGGKKMANPGDVRTEVVIALGNIASPGDKEVISALQDLTDKKQRDRTLKKAANEAIAKLKK
jgi:HEAT repeat protein